MIKVSTFIKNDICGEMAILADDSSATADVVADEDTVLIKIPHQISDHLKLHLLKSAYSKIKKSSTRSWKNGALSLVRSTISDSHCSSGLRLISTYGYQSYL